MSTSTWVVNAGAAGSTLEELEAALTVRRLAHLVLDAARVPEVMASAEPPEVAIVVGGRLSLSVVAALRSLRTSSVPTLVLVTALNEQQEAFLLSSGAFDVIGLPVSSVRLVSRMAAFLRNAARTSLTVGSEPSEHLALHERVQLLPGRREVRVHDRKLHLTRTEFDLLLLLGRTPGRVVSRREMQAELGDRSLSPRALESHVSRIRHKLVAAGGPPLIETVWGVGYRLHIGPRDD